ncbi:MAG: D-galactose-binding periplasmic protein precursor [Candidatus Izimaplasma bacterium HR2]|nr:MAG: D-galactose-binding periplasmic protein precursor [Candidatus Izimaplasma bacterium HR2]
MRRNNIVLLLIIIAFLGGCKSKNNVVPLLIYNDADPYMEEFRDNILERTPDEYSIEAYDSQNSQIIQNEFIENLLKEEPPVMIINPVDRLGAYTIVLKAKEVNVPVIFINREPLEEDLYLWDQVYYVGAPAERSAELQSEIIMELFGDSNALGVNDLNGDNIIQVILLKGEQGHQDAETRTEVVMNELETNGYEVEILVIEIANWKTSEGYEAMMELLPIYGEQLELVISNNDAMAIGAIQALMELEYFQDLDNDGFIDHETEPWIPVVGIDGITEALELITSGYLYGTVINDSESMAEAIIELTTAIINGDDVNTISYILIDNKYIWVDYKKYVLDEN